MNNNPEKNQICPVCKKQGIRSGCYNRCDQNNIMSKNNLEKEILETGELRVSDFRCSEHGLITPKPTCPKCEKTISKVREKERNQPIGVSEWKNLGKKFGYWDFFVKEERKRIIEIIEKTPTEKPEYESDDYDIGRKDFKQDIINKINK